MSSLSMRYNTMDLVVMAVLAAIGGVLGSFAASLYIFLAALGGPYLGTFAAIFYWPGILAVYLRRKPGICLITIALNIVLQFLLGNPLGLLTLGFVGEAVLAELAFTATRYRNYGAVVCFLSAGLASLYANSVWVPYIFNIPQDINLLSAPLWFITSGVESGLILGWGVGKAIERSGLVKIPKIGG